MADPIAVYGAITGTAGAMSAAWTVYHSWFRDRAKLTTSVTLAVIGMHPERLWCISVEVSNTGRRPITIQRCVLGVSRRERLFFFPGAVRQYGPLGLHVDGTHKMPKRLEEGESHQVLFPCDSVRESLAERDDFRLECVVVGDATGREWKTKAPKGVRAYFKDATADEVKTT